MNTDFVAKLLEDEELMSPLYKSCSFQVWVSSPLHEPFHHWMELLKDEGYFRHCRKG
jgi:hypothetical protein